MIALTGALWGGGVLSSPARAQETRSIASCPPQRQFSALWETFDQSYGLFKAKNVDWRATRAVFEPQALAVGNCDEL